MSVKKDLRIKLKAERRECHSIQLDKKICDYIKNNDDYKIAELILSYAAIDDEINIDELIEDALLSGKRVALPRCLDDKGSMNFCYIKSLDDVKDGFFGVREPDENAVIVTDFSNSICLVPAIAYDTKGYRLGYGKGYYDRFLKNYSSISIGLCYNELVINKIPIGEYDIPVDYIISECGVIRF